MAFLQTVLKVQDSTKVEDISDKLMSVHQNVGNLKYELSQSLNACFELFDSDLDKISSWRFELLEINKNVKYLQDDFNHMRVARANTGEEFEAIEKSLDENQMNIELLNYIIEIVQNLEAADVSTDPVIASERFKRATSEFPQIYNSFPALDDNEWIKSLNYLIKRRVSEAYEFAQNEWKMIFRFDKNSFYISDILSCKEGGRVKKLLYAFANLGYHEEVWQDFVKNIWSHLFSKASSIDHKIEISPYRQQMPTPTEQLRQQQQQQQHQHESSNSLQDSGFGTNRESISPSSVTINNNLNLALAPGIRISFKKLNIKIKNSSEVFNSILKLLCEFKKIFEADLMTELSNTLSPMIFDSLSADFLNILILQNSQGNIENIKEDIISIKNFVNVLREDFNFLIPMDNSFVNFEDNFMVLFKSQVRRDLLSNVRRLIQSDANTVRIDLNESFIKEDEENKDESDPNIDPFELEQYTISYSISEMISLLESHLNTYPEDLDLIENAYNFYVSIVTIPKQDSDKDDLSNKIAILTHNNCRFLVYHATNTFKMLEHMIPLLQEKANNAFSYMLRNCRTKVNGLISKAMLNLEDITADQRAEVTSKFMKIYSEFSRLNSTYKDILPPSTWRETLATIVDHTLNEICLKIINWDDISETTGTEVANGLTQFGLSTSRLFQRNNMSQQVLENSVLVKLLKKWQRFRLLIFILTASMRDIDDKWVGGCGPLALDFTPDEVRKLVRALFQNNERRAAFLQSIK